MEQSNLLLVVAPLILIELVMKVVALVHISRHPTRGPKWAWVLAVLLASTIGWLAYFLVGREDR